MTMRFIPTTLIASGSSHALNSMYAFFDFMRQASPTGPGWTVPRSSDGSTIVTDGTGSNITSGASLSQFVSGSSESWFVLRSPDGLKEFLFRRAEPDDFRMVIVYSPGALFIGGDAGNEPTAVDVITMVGGGVAMTSQATSVLHMGADDAAPYGFFTYMHTSGNFATSQGMGLAWCPITAGLQPGDIDPYVFVRGLNTVEGYLTTRLISEFNDGSQSANVRGIIPGAGERTISALRIASFNQLFPNNVNVDGNGADLSMPVAFGVRSGGTAPTGFKGFTNFMQWNGFQRAAGETFASRTRVSWGDVNFPWDGSVPEIS